MSIPRTEDFHHGLLGTLGVFRERFGRPRSRVGRTETRSKPVIRFHPATPRAEAWKIATEIALHALRHHDRALGVEPQILHVPDRYSVRVQDLAVARFNIWAKRGLAAIDDKNALPEYGEWLETYVTNWLAYVTDTCPKLDVRQSLHERLAERTVTWVDRAWSIARD